MTKNILAWILFLTLSPWCLGVSTTQEILSPDQRIQVGFWLENGEPYYSVNYLSVPIITRSRLGLRLKNNPALNGPFTIADIARSERRETWEQVWGEERLVLDHHQEFRVELKNITRPNSKLVIFFRVFNDGVGFRYLIPKQVGMENFVISDELSEFNFAKDHKAWWIPAFTKDRYEERFRYTALSKVPIAHTPLTIEGDGIYIALHEANLTDYSSMTLKKTGKGHLKCHLVPWVNGDLVRGNPPLFSPWRTVQIGKTPGDLAVSNLILNLNEPNRIQDTSWIKPKKYLGIWWGMHLKTFTWESGKKHGATTENTKRYIDAAVKLGIPGLLVEGWNVGWDGDWQKNGALFNFTKPYPDFDLEGLAKYASSVGVELIGHHETAANIQNYEKQVDAAFALYHRLGIHSVKTGYVGSKVDGGEWHHGQFMVRHHQKIVEKAAQYQIMIDAHEPIKDTGLRRTYPNYLSREGARGQEYNAWDVKGGNPVNHTSILPFTRSLAGPFDYTPGIFDVTASAIPFITRVWSTIAHQLALYVVIYSPLQMAADLPENYFNHPMFQFIRDVPTDWDKTLVLNGEIGKYTTFVRKDRASRDWYLGSITDQNARTLVVNLNFLEESKYCATIYGDGPKAHYRRHPKDYQISKRTVTPAESLTLKLAAGGGQAIQFKEGACE